MKPSAPSSQAVPPLTAFGTTLAVAVLLIVLPFSWHRASTSRAAAEAHAERLVGEIVARQDEVLRRVVAMQANVASVRGRIAQLRRVARLDETAITARETSTKGAVDGVSAAALEAEKDLDSKLKQLDSETTATFRELKQQLDIRKNRFLVKWHGDDGVKTSKRMPTEVEALNFFNQVGEFAKKLLMFDGRQWVVVREYGGENWLGLMHNDGEIQDGDGKPSLKPKAAKPAG